MGIAAKEAATATTCTPLPTRVIHGHHHHRAAPGHHGNAARGICVKTGFARDPKREVCVCQAGEELIRPPWAIPWMLASRAGRFRQRRALQGDLALNLSAGAEICNQTAITSQVCNTSCPLLPDVPGRCLGVSLRKPPVMRRGACRCLYRKHALPLPQLWPTDARPRQFLLWQESLRANSATRF